MVSRAAAFFFSWVGKYCPIFEKKEEVSSRTFFSHPAGPPETYLFLWTALKSYNVSLFATGQANLHLFISFSSYMHQPSYYLYLDYIIICRVEEPVLTGQDINDYVKSYSKMA